MTFDKKNSLEAEETELQQALQSFRQSVHAWSEAEYARPRSVQSAAVRHTWKWALTWAMGCALAIGGLGVGLYEHNQQQAAKGNGTPQQQQMTAAATQSAAPEVKAPAVKEAPVQEAEVDASLLAAVDRDVSRQVPSEMEPLAQLMESEVNR
jgi:hypothetical protein